MRKKNDRIVSNDHDTQYPQRALFLHDLRTYFLLSKSLHFTSSPSISISLQVSLFQCQLGTIDGFYLSICQGQYKLSGLPKSKRFNLMIKPFGIWTTPSGAARHTIKGTAIFRCILTNLKSSRPGVLKVAMHSKSMQSECKK